LPAAGEAVADVHLRFAVINRDVNIVDTGIQNRMQDAFRLAGQERSTDTGDHTAQL
jgi:hypothetical protein